MKKLHTSLALSAAVLLFAAVPLLQAGPGPQFWSHASTAPKTAVTAPATTSPHAACAQCGNCPGCGMKKPENKAHG